MYSLEVDVLFQVSSQLDLSTVLAHGPIIHQKEMGMQVVENVEFAERVQQCLIWSNNLQYDKKKESSSVPLVLNIELHNTCA